MRIWSQKGFMGFLAILLIAVLLLSITACSSSPSETKTIKVGFIVTVTGTASSSGIPIQRSWLLPFEQVNEAGGLKIGGDTYKFELYSEDDAYSAQQAVTAVNKLISEDGVKFIIGPFSTAGCQAIAPICQESNVLAMLGGKGGSLLNSSMTMIFQPFPISAYLGPVYWKYISDNVPEASKVAILYASTSTGKEAAPIDEAAINHYGLNVVYKQSYSSGTTDFYSYLTPLLQTHPDLIDIAGGTESEVGLVIKQARELGYTGKFGSVMYAGAKTIVGIAGANADGLITNSFITEGLHATEATKSWVETYRSRYGLYDDLSLGTSDMSVTLIEGIKAAKSVDPVEVRDALEQMTSFGLNAGTYGWTGEKIVGINHIAIRDIHISQIQNGQFVGLYRFTLEEVKTILDEYYQ